MYNIMLSIMYNGVFFYRTTPVRRARCAYPKMYNVSRRRVIRLHPVKVGNSLLFMIVYDS